MDKEVFPKRQTHPQTKKKNYLAKTLSAKQGLGHLTRLLTRPG